MQFSSVSAKGSSSQSVKLTVDRIGIAVAGANKRVL